ncbi:MAG: S16 family serine protease, partial [Acidimicrobiales bacterium]
PKDGPSAGVTMTSALVSLLRGIPVRPAVGMTGEVTLRGRVLPIGGVRQKVLAAHRAGLTDVVLPARNGPDLEDVPEEVRESMRFHLAEHVDQVLEVALGEGGGVVGATAGAVGSGLAPVASRAPGPRVEVAHRPRHRARLNENHF